MGGGGLGDFFGNGVRYGMHVINGIYGMDGVTAEFLGAEAEGYEFIGGRIARDAVLEEVVEEGVQGLGLAHE